MSALLARIRAAFHRSYDCTCGTDWISGEPRPCAVHPTEYEVGYELGYEAGRRLALALAVLGALADDIERAGDDVSTSCARRLRTCIGEIRHGLDDRMYEAGEVP